MRARRQNIQAAIMGQYKIFGRIRTWPSWAHTRHMFSSCRYLLWAITISSAVARALSYGHIVGLHETFVWQFSYMCLVGPYEAHTEYIFMGPYIYMHLSYTMGPHWLYRGICEIVTWALPSTMTQICIMGSVSDGQGLSVVRTVTLTICRPSLPLSFRQRSSCWAKKSLSPLLGVVPWRTKFLVIYG